MGQEQELEIQKVEVGDRTFNNLYLKSNLKRGIKGLDDGNYVIFEKMFPSGIPIKSKFENSEAYNCRVKYKGEECSFLLGERTNKLGQKTMTEHTDFESCGGVGDKVKITLNKVPVQNPVTGAEVLSQRLTFEKVE